MAIKYYKKGIEVDPDYS